jgi:hypothetical protein
MTTEVITGQPDWPLERVAEVMGKHQIRRLPIVQDGAVVGIVSLGDVALHMQKREPVAQSLRDISESGQLHRSSRPLRLLKLAVPLALVIGVIWLSDARARRAALEAVEATGLLDRARQAAKDGERMIRDPRTQKRARQFTDQARRQAQALPEQLRHLVEQPKPRRFWFA